MEEYKKAFDKMRKENMNEFEFYDSYKKCDNKLTEDDIEAFYAIRKKQVREFKEINLRNVNVKYKDSYLLLEAILYGVLEIVVLLVNKGADLSIVDKYGRSPIQLALICNEISITKYLFNHKYDFNISEGIRDLLKNILNPNNISEQDSTGASLLHYICAMGLEDMLNNVDLSNPTMIDILQRKDKEGYTCIDRAAANGHLEIVKRLKNILKFDLSYTNPIANSILFKSLSESPNGNVLQWWLDNHVSYEIPHRNILFEINGRSAESINSKFRIIINRANEHILRELYGNSNNVVMNIVRKFNGEIKLNTFGILTPGNKNLYLNQINSDNQTIADIAALNNHSEVITLLINSGFKNLINNTCLEHVIEKGYYRFVKYIMNNTNVNDEFALSLLNLAIMNDKNEIFHYLFEKFKHQMQSRWKLPEFRIKEEKNNNETHIQMLLRIIEISRSYLDESSGFILNLFKYCNLKNLIELGIPFLYYSDKAGAKAIHILALFGRNEIILWYALNNYNIFETDRNGYTCLYYARMNKQDGTICLLQRLGVSFDNNEQLLDNQNYNDNGDVFIDRESITTGFQQKD